MRRRGRYNAKLILINLYCHGELGRRGRFLAIAGEGNQIESLRAVLWPAARQVRAIEFPCGWEKRHYTRMADKKALCKTKLYSKTSLEKKLTRNLKKHKMAITKGSHGGEN